MKYKYEVIVELKLKSLKNKELVDHMVNYLEVNGIKIGTITTIPLKDK